MPLTCEKGSYLTRSELEKQLAALVCCLYKWRQERPVLEISDQLNLANIIVYLAGEIEEFRQELDSTVGLSGSRTSDVDIASQGVGIAQQEGLLYELMDIFIIFVPLMLWLAQDSPATKEQLTAQAEIRSVDYDLCYCPRGIIARAVGLVQDRYVSGLSPNGVLTQSGIDHWQEMVCNVTEGPLEQNVIMLLARWIEVMLMINPAQSILSLGIEKSTINAANRPAFLYRPSDLEGRPLTPEEQIVKSTHVEQCLKIIRKHWAGLMGEKIPLELWMIEPFTRLILDFRTAQTAQLELIRLLREGDPYAKLRRKVNQGLKIPGDHILPAITFPTEAQLVMTGGVLI